MKRKIFINLLLIILFFGMIKYSSYKIAEYKDLQFKDITKDASECNTDKYTTKYRLLEDFSLGIWRKSTIIENSKKKPIIWFGCSFAEGAGLEDNQAQSYKLAQISKRSVIQQSKGATGPAFMYYQLKNNLVDEQANDAEYVIYTYISNHLYRLYEYKVNPFIPMFNIRYKIKDGNLVERKPIFKPLYSLFFVQRLANKDVINKVIAEEQDYLLFDKMMKETNNLIKEKYPKAKFIILEFPDRGNEIPDFEVKKLEENGITFVRLKDLIKDKSINIYDEKYWLPGNIHPNEKLWDLALPELNKRFLK